MSFAASWPSSAVAQADLTQPLPRAQRSMQQVQDYDRQQAQQTSHLPTRQAQINAQQGPEIGTPAPGSHRFGYRAFIFPNLLGEPRA
ncbi:MAG: hypothetical protein ABI379_02790 [Rhodanobacter sp.]